jgi:hypothetical protein
MRKIRQVLRLANTTPTPLSIRAMATSLGISRDSVSNYILRGKAVGLTWPLPDDVDEAELKARLFPTAMLRLKRRGANLSALRGECLEANRGWLRCTHFCDRYLGSSNPTVVDATLDRLVAGADRLALKDNTSIRGRRRPCKD